MLDGQCRVGHWCSGALYAGRPVGGARQLYSSMAAKPAAMRSATQRCHAATGSLEGITREPSAEVLQTWRAAEAVCFDVDSTLCEDESIDELAAYLGHGEAVAALTSQAMGGSARFEDSLAARLGLMQPSQAAIAAFLRDRPPRFSKGIPQLVRRLQERDTAVFLVSGGFRVIINPIAQVLGIPLDRVFANTILHKEDGSYAGFDASELTSRSGGKLQAILRIKERHGFKVMAMIGDGATDLEARNPGGADIFIGYGGTVVRQNIAEQADWYVMDIQELTDAL